MNTLTKTVAMMLCLTVPAGAMSLPRLAKYVEKRNVTIIKAIPVGPTYIPERVLGAGVVISQQGVILTAAHLVPEKDHAFVQYYGEEGVELASVAAVSPENDLAILVPENRSTWRAYATRAGRSPKVG